MTYGVTTSGFVRKPLAQILSEIEAGAVAVFGPGLIQSPESPMGQMNGLMTSLIATAWEIGESAYQSYDPDQAEGVRLEMLGRIRLLERMSGESDADFREAITNAGRARIDLADINRAVASVQGVSWSRVYVNDSSATDANGLEPHSVAVAVIGGLDEAVAAAIRPYVVPGVATYGNTFASVVVAGFCRSVRFIRPVEKRVCANLDVKISADSNGCPPPSASALAFAIATELAGANRPANGDDLTLHRLRMALAAMHPNAEIVSAMGFFPDTPPGQLPLQIDFFEILSLKAVDISVSIV